jgi:RNA polymerase sigma-70 factor (ECF subfamily)
MAEDIVQDVFVKIWEKKEDLAAVERFDSYMYVLARNHALNTLKKLAYDRAKNLEAARSIKTLYHANELTETSSDYYSLLDQAVDELPPQQQKVYILSRHKRLKYNEIAQQMQLSSETVKKYLKLATRSITSYLRTNTEK